MNSCKKMKIRITFQWALKPKTVISLILKARMGSPLPGIWPRLIHHRTMKKFHIREMRMIFWRLRRSSASKRLKKALTLALLCLRKVSIWETSPLTSRLGNKMNYASTNLKIWRIWRFPHQASSIAHPQKRVHISQDLTWITTTSPIMDLKWINLVFQCPLIWWLCTGLTPAVVEEKRKDKPNSPRTNSHRNMTLKTIFTLILLPQTPKTHPLLITAMILILQTTVVIGRTKGSPFRAWPTAPPRTATVKEEMDNNTQVLDQMREERAISITETLLLDSKRNQIKCIEVHSRVDAWNATKTKNKDGWKIKKRNKKFKNKKKKPSA